MVAAGTHHFFRSGNNHPYNGRASVLCRINGLSTHRHLDVVVLARA
jgi:hypothetical protein